MTDNRRIPRPSDVARRRSLEAPNGPSRPPADPSPIAGELASSRPAFLCQYRRRALELEAGSGELERRRSAGKVFDPPSPSPPPHCVTVALVSYPYELRTK
jgi:hypothetical protein